MTSLRSLVAAVTIAACVLCLNRPLAASADVTNVVDTTPASSLNGCVSSISFTATVYGTPGTEFYWIVDYVVSGVPGNTQPLYGDSARIDSSGAFKLQYTFNIPPNELGRGHFQFNTQTTPATENYNSPGVTFNTACVQPTTYSGVTFANMTVAPESGACAGYMRLGGLILNDTRATAILNYHWLYGGKSSPEQTVTIPPLLRATVGLAVEPYPTDSGTVQLVVDSTNQSSTPMNYNVSAPIAHNAPPTHPLDPSKPPAPATPPPPVVNCL